MQLEIGRLKMTTVDLLQIPEARKAGKQRTRNSTKRSHKGSEQCEQDTCQDQSDHGVADKKRKSHCEQLGPNQIHGGTEKIAESKITRKTQAVSSPAPAQPCSRAPSRYRLCSVVGVLRHKPCGIVRYPVHSGQPRNVRCPVSESGRSIPQFTWVMGDRYF